MKAAVILTILGTALLFGVGILHLNLEVSTLCLAWFSANFFGATDLILTLELQRHKILRSALASWVFFLGYWLGCQALVSPFLRDPQTLAILFFPLSMCTGPCIIVWGEFQDWLVSRRQRALSSKQT